MRVRSHPVLRSGSLPPAGPRLVRRVLCAVALGGAACATGAPSPLTRAGDALPEAEIERRLEFIEQRLEASRRSAAIWHWSWLAINGGAGTALNTGLAVTDDSSEGRSAAIVQAIYGAVGVAFQALEPMNARRGADPLLELPEETRGQKLRKLERAEVILQENAERHAQRSSWLQHLGNAVVSAAAGLIVFAFGGDTDAWITGGSIFAGGELFLWTTPPGPVRDLEDYRALTAERKPRSALSLRF